MARPPRPLPMFRVAASRGQRKGPRRLLREPQPCNPQDERRMRRIARTMSVSGVDLLIGTSLTPFLAAEFALDIGNGLLTEVRRLQALLTEREQALQDMKEFKDNKEGKTKELRVCLHSSP